MGNFAFLRGTREGFVKDLDHPDHSLGSEDTWAGRGQLRIVLGTHERVAAVGRPRSIRRGTAHLRQAARGEARTSASTTPPACGAVRTSDLTSGKNIQQGASAKLAVRLNRTTTLTSLTAYRKSNYRFFIDADATELHAADIRRA